MTDAVTVEGLRFAYAPLSSSAPAPWVLDGANLRVEQGEWLAVMGASDAGKTTLCLLLAGLAPHLTGGEIEGNVVVDGRDTREFPPPQLAGSVGLLFQEPEAQLFNPTAEAEVAWGLENLGLPVAEIQGRVDEMLALLHLSEARSRSPAKLSGGEKKRLALASVLAMHPRVLVLDEPMGGLDPAGRAEVLAALSALRRDHSVSIVMSESDPEAVAAFADRLVVLHEGRIALEGQPRALFHQAKAMAAFGVAIPQMAHLATALNKHLGTAFDFLTVDEAQSALVPYLSNRDAHAAVREDQPSHRVDLPSSPLPTGASKVPSLQVRDLWFSYEAGAPVLYGVDLDVPQGQFIALVGANGSGKTTLVKHFNGLLRPQHGQILLNGEGTAHRPVGDLARQVGFLFQHPEQQIFSPTVRQELAFGPRNLGLPAGEVEERVDAALARFSLETVAESPPAILSYGLRRRVTLASLAAIDPPILVLDEPTVGLDDRGLEETFRWLAMLRAQGRTIMLVTHDMSVVAQYADRAVVLKRGRIVADGPPIRLFGRGDLLRDAALVPPPLAALAQSLGPYGLPGDSTTVEGLCAELVALVGNEHHAALVGRQPS